ncbi:MAG: type II secretion system F family protein, partial [Desulfarculus sp.]|nr:type II secretion system F family protein [Pseudomonadota bacterium]MBV1751897.1 type II secretion system F family protein [Desulfarculus sp.]
QSYFRDRSYSTIPYLNRLLGHLPNISDLELLIHQAGSPCNLGTLVLMSGVLASLGFLGGLLESGLTTGLILAVGCGVLPLMWLRFLRKRRLAAFEEQFVEAVDLMARALRAGHSFGSGLKMASQELEDPVAEELARTFEDYSFGKGLDDALRDLTRRVGLQDVKFFATAVALQREIGGNLTEILDNIGHITRARFALLRQVKALSAEGRISAYILCLMAPGLLGALWFLSPNYLGILFEHPMGKTLLMVGGCFQGLGILVIRKLINLKV